MISFVAIELGILIAIFLIAGVLVFLRSDLTLYHIPVIMLALFALTSGVMIPVGAEMIQTDAEKIDYRVESQVEGCDTVDEQATEFSELSPDARDVFLSTHQSDKGYTTTVHPDEYDLSTDTTQENYIVYESECYLLVGYYRGGLHYGILSNLLFIIGIPVTIGLATLAGFSYHNKSFRTPTAAVSGLTVLVGLHRIVGLRSLLPMSFLLAAVVWVLLEDFEPDF